MHRPSEEALQVQYSLSPLTYRRDMHRTEVAGARETLFERLDIDAGDRVLEIGIGPGMNFEHYNPDAHHVGIDLNPDFLRMSQRHSMAGDTDLALTNARSLPFGSGTFDVGIATYAFCGVTDNHGAFEEIQRVVRPGGRIGVLDFTRTIITGFLSSRYGFAGHNLNRLVRDCCAPGTSVRDHIVLSRMRYGQSIYILDR